MANENLEVGLGLPSKIENAADFRELYVNHIQLAMTPFDLLITFGHIYEGTEAQPAVKNDVAIRVSPQTFKTLSVNLAGAIAAWESQFGPISVTNRRPEDVLASLKTFMKKQKPDAIVEKKKP
jgi:hypothetical protein